MDAYFMGWKIRSMHLPIKTVKDIIYFCVYWIGLGIASSIGLGTGLHTFVLYLGPFIAKVAMAATQCGYLPEMVPSKWKFNHFEDCKGKFNHMKSLRIMESAY